MKVALIGSCGYIGSIIYDTLKDIKNINLICYDRSADNIYPPHIKKNVNDITIDEINSIDIIIYLAGLCNKNICDNLEYNIVYDNNINNLLNIIKYMNDNQLCIYSSTAALYMNNENIINNEEHEINIDRLHNYELSMYNREIEINKLNKRTIGLRMGSIIGLSKNMKLDMLLNAIYYQAFLTKSINIWNPNSYRSILWHEDLTNIIQLIIKNKDIFIKPNIFNLSSFNTTVYKAAEYVSKNLGIKYNIVNDFNNLGFQINCDKLFNLLNYNPIGTHELIYNVFTKNKNKFLEIVNNTVKVDNKKCIICGHRLHVIIELGYQPLANDLQETDSMEVKKYPLELYRCKNCFHTQLGHFINREVLFKKYLYESGTSNTSRKYFSEFAENYTNKCKSIKKNILEIACNDGSQLDEFLKRGWSTYGVEPAENIVGKAISKGHKVKCAFWGNTINNVSFDNVDFDIILAQNVFAHVTNPIDFLMNCYENMNDNTLLVIQTSQANMYINGEFDTIYHEHISFFTIKSMMYAAESINCSLVNVYKTYIHGTSYVFEIKKGIDRISLPLLDEEIKAKIYDDDMYIRFSINVSNKKQQAIEMLNMYKNNNFKIIGYGAAAKGIVFLNYLFNSSPNKILPEYIIEESPLKLGLYTPCTNIQLTSIDILKTYNKICIIILAWNFADEINDKIKIFKLLNNLNIEIETVCYFPDIKITKL